MSEQEYSESGNPIYRHQQAEQKMPRLSEGNEPNIEAIEAHLAKHIGEAKFVFHELVSDQVHIDVHFIPPSEKFPFNILVTSGMSDRPMTVPEGLENLKYAEVCILLPEDWPLSQEDFKDENNYWPVRWLKTIARLPHQYNTWLGYGHTIPNGEEAEPFADSTGMGCLILMPAISLPDEFSELVTPDGKTIHFYCLYPLYKDEMDFKLQHGTDALLDLLDESELLDDVVDENRPTACA